MLPSGGILQWDFLPGSLWGWSLRSSCGEAALPAVLASQLRKKNVVCLWGSGMSPSALPPGYGGGAGVGPATYFYFITAAGAFLPAAAFSAFTGLVGPAVLPPAPVSLVLRCSFSVQLGAFPHPQDGVVLLRCPGTSGPSSSLSACVGSVAAALLCWLFHTCLQPRGRQFSFSSDSDEREVQHKFKIVKCLVLFCSFPSCTLWGLAREEAPHL